MFDLLCLGEPMFEFSHINHTEWREGFGGDVSNVAVAAARHGAQAGIISRLGDDSFGAALRNFWDENKVDHSHVAASKEHPTGIYFIRQTDAGHEFEYRRAGSAASHIRPDSLGALNTRMLHFSGISLAISESSKQTCMQALEKVRANGGQVSYDPNLRLNLTTLKAAQADQQAVLEAGCDIVLPGFDDAKLLTGCDSAEAIAQWYLNAGVSLVALTLGSEGALIATQETMQHLPQRPTTTVDASGAGDCFDGCLLARLSLGDDVITAAKYAVIAASLSVEKHGAATAIPTKSEVELLLG